MDFYTYINYFIIYILYSFYKTIFQDIQKTIEIPGKVISKSTLDIYDELKRYFEVLNMKKLLKNDGSIELPSIPSPFPLLYKTLYTLQIPIERIINSNLFGIKDSLDFKNFMNSLRSNTLLLKDKMNDNVQEEILTFNVEPFLDDQENIPVVQRKVKKRFPTVQTPYLDSPSKRLSRGFGFTPR